MLPHTHSTLINVNSSLLTLVFPCWLKEDRVMMANGIWHFSNLSPKFWYLRTVKNSYIHIQMCTQRELFSFQNLFFKKETIYDKEYKIGEIFYLYLFCYKCLNFPTYIFLYNKDTLFLLSFFKAINVYVVYEATFFLSSLVSSCLCPTTLEILKILKTLSWSSWLGLYATTPAGNLEVKPGPGATLKWGGRRVILWKGQGEQGSARCLHTSLHGQQLREWNNLKHIFK